MLACEEITKFQAVNNWSENCCMKNELEITSENKRRTVGNVILTIKFDTMSLEEFP